MSLFDKRLKIMQEKQISTAANFKQDAQRSVEKENLLIPPRNTRNLVMDATNEKLACNTVSAMKQWQKRLAWENEHKKAGVKSSSYVRMTASREINTSETGQKTGLCKHSKWTQSKQLGEKVTHGFLRRWARRTSIPSLIHSFLSFLPSPPASPKYPRFFSS